MRIADAFTGGRLKIALAFSMRIAAAVLSFGTTWLIARLYGAAGVGIYSLAVSTAITSSYLAAMGLDSVVIRMVASELHVGNRELAHGVVRAAFRAALAAAGTATLLVIAGGLMISIGWFPIAGAGGIALAAPAVVGQVVSRMSSATLRARGSVAKSQVLDGLAGAVVMLLFMLSLAVTGWRPPMSVLCAVYAGSQLLSAVIGLVFTRRRLRDLPSPAPIESLGLIKAGLPVMVGSLSISGVEWLALFFTNYVAGTEAAGQLRIAVQVMIVMTLINAAFDSVLGPRLAALWRIRDDARIRSIFRQSALGVTLLASPLLGVSLFAPEVILRVVGEDFTDGANMLRVLAVGQALTVLGGPMGTLLIMSGNARMLLWCSAAGVGCAALVTLLGVPVFGALTGAVMIAAVMVCRRVAAGLVVRYMMKFRVF